MRHLYLFFALTLCAAGQGLVSDSGRAFMVIDTIYSAPSGKVVRIAEHRAQWHSMDHYSDPVRVTLKVGCPVCGSERTTYDELNEKEPGIWVRHPGISTCSDCGTVYSGRRK